MNDKVKKIIEELRKDLADPSTELTDDYYQGYEDALNDIQVRLEEQDL